MALWSRRKRVSWHEGDVVISNVRIGPNDVEEPVVKPDSKHEVLVRGDAQDTTLAEKGMKIQLGRSGSASVNGTDYSVQTFPAQEEALPHLPRGAKTPYGRVQSVSFNGAAQTWTVFTDKYPAGVQYNVGGALVGGRKQ